MKNIITTIDGINEKVLTSKSGNKYLLIEIEPEYIIALDMQRGNKFMTGWCGTLNEDEDNLKYFEAYERKLVKEEQKRIDFESKIQELEIANAMMRKAILQLTSSREQQDVRVSRADFLKIYDDALQQMFDMNEDLTKENQGIYEHNVTVHWHGIYCDCGDGATPSNHIIPGIAGCDEECDGEEW